uniref:BTB domain-containing protein n=1 Tax=Angiostrongylus cantonensis TaxID=6313 RepID=A0A0K0D4B4_ANGCA
LMQMYLSNQDTDVVIRTESGDLHAHKYSRNAIHFLLTFLYGGLTSIPDEVDVWEIIALATHLNHKDLADVVILHLKATRCHWFHRVLAWQAKHFARIWKGRVFGHLNERWQKECYEAVIQELDDETLIDTILGCERLQGLALNLGVLEGLLPSVVHYLSADVAIKAFKGLDNLLQQFHTAPSSPSHVLKIPVDEYGPRFCLLVRRIYELIDKHLLHYAASVVKSEAWHLLSKHQQARIEEGELFIIRY